MKITQILQQAESKGGIHGSLFEKIISKENIFVAWREFRSGKRWKEDVLEFGKRAEETLLQLHDNLKKGVYQHSRYDHFLVHDPKLRHIHKASVCDRILHHALHRILEPLFDLGFIFDSYSSRKNKGTHTAIRRFEKLAWKLSQNRTRTVWVLQCDIRKFFDSIDQSVLLRLLKRKIIDEELMSLLMKIIGSFSLSREKGIPLGNLTSQLFANIYLNPLDQYMKRSLRVSVYLRYADDILLAHTDKKLLLEWLSKIDRFVREELKLVLHPNKTTIRKWQDGIDWLGYISFPTQRVLRTKTKRRMMRRLTEKNASSYFGVTRHARAHGLEVKMHDILNI